MARMFDPKKLIWTTVTFYVSIEDKDFLKQIDEGLPFSKGDILHVQLETKQSVTAEGILKTENVATKILEHRSAARQIHADLFLWESHISTKGLWLCFRKTLSALLAFEALNLRLSIESSFHHFDSAIVACHFALAFFQARERK